MADLTITASNVVLVDGNTSEGYAGETITAGQPVYLKSSDELLYKGDNDAGTAPATAAIKGIALNGASVGQPVTYQTSGTITIGATVTVGTIYVLSATAGGICPAADLASGDYVTIIGVASTAAIITMFRTPTGIQVP